MRITFLHAFIFLGSLLATAQPYPSTKGSFQVNERRGCAPLTINVTQLISNSFTAQYFYEPGSNPTQSTTHTFNNPGTYVVQAVYNGLIPNSTDNTDNITITVTQNNQPTFEISSCSNSQVSIKVTNSQYNQYLVDFNNDNTVDATIPASGSQTANFTYPNNTIKTITVRGRDTNGADNCLKRTQTVTPLLALPPATINTLTVVDASSIKLDYTPSTNIQYRGVIATDNAASFQIFQSFNSASNTPQSLTQSSLATDDHYYCFRLNSYDPCNNTNVASNTICSANLDLTINNKSNSLNWVTSTTGVTNYSIIRNKANYQTSATTSYNDNTPAITCNTDYCYSITTNYSNGTRSFSLEKCGKAISTDIPTAIENLSAAFVGVDLKLDWIQDPAFTPKSYSVNSSYNNGPFNSIGSTTTPTYTDNMISLSDNNLCYNITYLDVCNNTSPVGITACPILLSGSLASDNSVLLSWNSFDGWKNGVKQYRIIKYDVDGAQIASFTTNNLTYQDNSNDPDHQAAGYQVTALANDAGLSNSVSNLIIITREARLIFPTAFTPNNDRLNDSFTVVGQYVEKMTLQIFDRWGTLIFSTDSNEPWDGTQQGKPMPESSYVWKALITDKTGHSLTKIGAIALLRK